MYSILFFVEHICATSVDLSNINQCKWNVSYVWKHLLNMDYTTKRIRANYSVFTTYRTFIQCISLHHGRSLNVYHSTCANYLLWFILLNHFVVWIIHIQILAIGHRYKKSAHV